jgi:single-strand DNA-binding protein
MADLNKVLLRGSLGQDPELRMTSTGNAKLTLRLATSEEFMAHGQPKKTTQWHTVVVWGLDAEALGRTLSKGSTVFVEGRLQTRSWEGEGGKRYSTEVVADFVASTERSFTDRREQSNRQNNNRHAQTDAEANSASRDDDIPF